MKKILLALSALALTLLTACGGDAAASAAGTYEIDKTALADTIVASMPEAARSLPQSKEMATKTAEGMNVTIELKADGTARMDSKIDMMGNVTENSQEGTWKIEGGKLTLTVKEKDGKEDSKTTEIKDGTFTIEHEQGGQTMKMTFRRK